MFAQDGVKGKFTSIQSQNIDLFNGQIKYYLKTFHFDLSGQVRSECTFRASCCSACLPRAHALAGTREYEQSDQNR